MSETVIKVENLSKLYKLGLTHQDLISEKIMSGAKGIARTARRLLLRKESLDEGSATADSEHKKGRRSSVRGRNDHIWALKDVSFEVKRGEVLGIIGRNGAGKSTLLKILSQITEPTEGRVLIDGRVGSLLEVGTGFHPELTGKENIYLNGSILGMTRAETKKKLDEIVAFAEIEKFTDTPVKRYSSGMYVRLAFAVAAHLEPEILLVDEVLAVGDVAFQKKCMEKMGDVANEGRTILFVSHNMGAIRALCQRAVFLDHGRIVKDGAADTIVDFYISSLGEETTRLGEIVWDSNGAPGNEDIALIKAKLTDLAGKATSVFSPQQPIEFQIYYKLFKPLNGMRVVLQLLRSTGEVAFTTTDQSKRVQGHERPRKYKSSCHIPGGLLNTGDYIIKVWIGIPGVRYLIKPMNMLRLSIAGKGNQGSIFSEKWPGVVCPQIEWELLEFNE